MPILRPLALIVLMAVLLAGCSSSRSARKPLSPAVSPQEIAALRTTVNRRGGDPIMGRTIFRGRCAACHTAFGQGGDRAVDLTAYVRRPDYRDLLLNTLLPGNESHAIRTFTLEDGTHYTGILLDDSQGQITLATAPAPGGNRVTLNAGSLDPAAPTQPRHLLTGLTDQQVRDLFAYLLREAPAGR